MFHFRALASGSSGNAYLLKTQKARILFDAGLRLPTLRRHLAAEDLAPADLTAVLISHEHRDHSASVADLAGDIGVPVWANAEVLEALGLADTPRACVLEIGTPCLFGDVEVTTFPVQHDAVRPVGFVIRVCGRTIALATDLGDATPEVAAAVAESDLVVLESNHDRDMLMHGRYPHHLRKRVAGPTGHLSNLQAASLLARNLPDQSADVWLAHLSKENNTQALAVSTTRRLLREAGLGEVYVGIAARDRPSLKWNGTLRPRQLSLFDGVGTP